MPVLSRKPGERIVVPHCGLAVTVIAVEGKTVRSYNGATIHERQPWRHPQSGHPS